MTGGKKLLDELPALLKKSGLLGEIDWDFIRRRALPDEQVERLAKDLAGGDEALQKLFKESPEMVDSWKVLDDAGVDDVLRKNTNVLETINFSPDEDMSLV